jgi:hypothetical protein
MEGAAGQQPRESSPEPSDEVDRFQWKWSSLAAPPDSEQREVTKISPDQGRGLRVQRHPRAKMIVVRVDKLATYLEATWGEQP